MGGGLSYALASDIRLASPDAVFCAQYINIGLGGADVGSSYFLWRIVGWGRAAEMCMTGDRIPADEAYRIGLVNQVVPHDKLREETMNLAEQIANGPKDAVQLARYCIDASSNQTLRENLDLGMLCNNMTIETTQAGTKAWGQEKKKPDYEGK